MSRYKKEEVLEMIRQRQGEGFTSEDALDFSNSSLGGIDLSGLDISFCDFSSSDLTAANLSGVRAFKTKFCGAVLLLAQLDSAEFTGADFRKAILEEVSAKSVGLGKAILDDARFFGARLEDVTLSLASLVNTDMRNCFLDKARIREANLEGADFTNASLRSADLSLSKVSGASFNEADLREVRLRVLSGYHKASWYGVDIRLVNFSGAYQLRRFIVDQNFIREFRETSTFNEVVYYFWWISSDCGRSMLRWCFWILFQIFFFAAIYTYVEVDFGRYPTALSPVYYSVVTLTTLGYGDVVPKSMWGQVVAMCEVAIGYMMLGGLLSIFGNKIARRAD